jgi:hypothetical protein
LGRRGQRVDGHDRGNEQGAARHSFSSGVEMRVFISMPLLIVTLISCRGYDLDARLVNQDGLVPPDQYARYGREQAEEIAIAREFRQAEAAASYARTLPDVANVKADPQGLLLTVQFKSGWRTMVAPLDDGKRGAETAGLPARAGAGTSR